ncbi:hypothetical protein LXL04_003279 [Taraxacum kok-saghyz]
MFVCLPPLGNLQSVITSRSFNQPVRYRRRRHGSDFARPLVTSLAPAASMPSQSRSNNPIPSPTLPRTIDAQNPNCLNHFGVFFTVDKNSLEVAKKYYERAGVSHKVDVRQGLVVDTLKSMIENGEGCSYDFAFVVLVIDNVLWHGKVDDPMVNDKKTESIRSFNRALMEDKRVTISSLEQYWSRTSFGILKCVGDIVRMLFKRTLELEELEATGEDVDD